MSKLVSNPAYGCSILELLTSNFLLPRLRAGRDTRIVTRNRLTLIETGLIAVAVTRATFMEGYRLNRLFTEEQIASIVQGLADQISKDYNGRELVMVCILKGAFMFLSDLIRHLRIPVQVDFVRLASYGSGMKTCGKIEITKDVEIPLEKKDVLIIEDIIDSGRTLRFLKERLALSNPRSIKICALLDKKARREVEMEADYLGTDVDDLFIVGYGIDFNEHYRHLPEIYYVTPIDPSKE